MWISYLQHRRKKEEEEEDRHGDASTQNTRRNRSKPFNNTLNSIYVIQIRRMAVIARPAEKLIEHEEIRNFVGIFSLADFWLFGYTLYTAQK